MKACWAGVQQWPHVWAQQHYFLTGYPYSQEDLVLYLSGFFPFAGSSDRARFEPGNVCRAPWFSGIEVISYTGAGGRLGGGAAWESSDQVDVMEGDSTCGESFCCLLCCTFAYITAVLFLCYFGLAPWYAPAWQGLSSPAVSVVPKNL